MYFCLYIYHALRFPSTLQLNLKAFRTAFLLVGIFWVTWFPWSVNYMRRRITDTLTGSYAPQPTPGEKFVLIGNSSAAVDVPGKGSRSFRTRPLASFVFSCVTGTLYVHGDWDISVRLMTLLVLTFATALNPVIHYCNNR